MKIAVVSFANNSYSELIKRQKTEFKKYLDCDYYCFNNFSEIESPSHEAIPYAFKPYAIQKIKNLGYSKILWADSPVYPIKEINNVLNELNNNGILLIDNVGWSISSYTNINCLNILGMDLETANKAPMVMACFMAFDFENELTCKIFNEYLNHVNTGAYNGEWSNHRHDQSVISILAFQNNIKLKHPKNILCYANEQHHDEWRGTEELTSNRTP